MNLTPEEILFECEAAMEKATDYLKHELRGIRTGRASPGMIEFLKVEYYGSMTDLKAIAAISVPEPTQLLIKPFDQGAMSGIRHAIETSGLGFNPIVEQKQIRINVPAPSAERRAQYAARCKKLAEETKVVMRNARRDANKHSDGLKNAPGSHVPEDEIEQLKKEVQDLLKKHEELVDKLVEEKVKEVQTI